MASSAAGAAGRLDRDGDLVAGPGSLGQVQSTVPPPLNTPAGSAALPRMIHASYVLPSGAGRRLAKSVALPFGLRDHVADAGQRHGRRRWRGRRGSRSRRFGARCSRPASRRGPAPCAGTATAANRGHHAASARAGRRGRLGLRSRGSGDDGLGDREHPASQLGRRSDLRDAVGERRRDRLGLAQPGRQRSHSARCTTTRSSSSEESARRAWPAISSSTCSTRPPVSSQPLPAPRAGRSSPRRCGS